MAKKDKKAKKPEAKPADGEAQPKARSGRMLLIAAVLLSVVSLAGGFMLARFAFQQDAAQYEPDYVEETEEMAEGEEHSPLDDGHVVDPLAKDDHPATQAASLKKQEEEKAAEEALAEGEGISASEGLLEFNEILTNISGFDAQGNPTKSFLKLSIVLVYRPDPGASLLMQERKPFMRDLFNGYARGLTEADVRGMAGILGVKAELLKRARAAVGNDLPQEILISDLIVQ